MIPSKGGCFELTAGGKRIYSKLETGTFPDEDRVLNDLARALDAR